MTKTRGNIMEELISGDYQYVRIIGGNFGFYSDILCCWTDMPNGFVCDKESVPLLKGTNPEAGFIHDLVCRKNFLPKVTMTQATRIYLEFQRFYDMQESGNWPNRLWDWFRRGFKTSVVWLYPNFLYFQKFDIMATYEEITHKKL